MDAGNRSPDADQTPFHLATNAEDRWKIYLAARWHRGRMTRLKCNILLDFSAILSRFFPPFQQRVYNVLPLTTPVRVPSVCITHHYAYPLYSSALPVLSRGFLSTQSHGNNNYSYWRFASARQFFSFFTTYVSTGRKRGKLDQAQRAEEKKKSKIPASIEDLLWPNLLPRSNRFALEIFVLQIRIRVISSNKRFPFTKVLKLFLNA